MSSSPCPFMIALCAGFGAVVAVFLVWGFVRLLDVYMLLGFPLMAAGLTFTSACFTTGQRPTLPHQALAADFPDEKLRADNYESKKVRYEAVLRDWEALPVHVPTWLWPVGVLMFIGGAVVVGVRVDKWFNPSRYINYYN